MMDNQFDRFDSGNDELNELLSSDKIDSEEREELIKAFTATLIDDPLGDGKAEDYHSLFTTIQINYVDRKLTELRSAKNPTQADDEKALGYCNRLRELIDLFASEGKDLPPIKNTHPEDYESEIRTRREKEAELSALVDNDTKINNLLIQAQKYPDEDICNEILSNLEVLKAQISSCKKHGISIPQLHCNNPKEVAKTVDKLKSTADKRDNLYQLMTGIDEEISDVDSSGNYDKQSIDKIISLCDQQIKYIYQCNAKNYPLPKLKNNRPSDIKEKYNRYLVMFNLDSEISSLLSFASTINQYNSIVEKCNLQDENIKICKCQNWGIPPLENNNINRIRENAQNQVQSIRFSKAAQSNALVETDNKIKNLLSEAKSYPDKRVCNEILKQVEILNNQIEKCKTNHIPIPQLYCDNTKAIVETVNELISIAEKRDNLYQQMFEIDGKISDLNSSGDYNKQNLKLIRSLCDQQNSNILQCRTSGYPLPELKNKQPSDAIAQHKHYANMIELDRKISTDLLLANTIIQHKKAIENCDKQAENIEMCLKKDWSVPKLANSNIQLAKETVQRKINIKEKKYKVRLAIIGAAALVVLVITLIIVFTVKSHEGKSAFPYDSAYAKGQNVESVQKGLSDAGFTNIVLDKDESGWAKEGTVLGISDEYNKGTYYDSDSEIHIKYSCEGRIEVSDLLKNWQSRKYNDVVSTLKSAGFNDISTEKTGILNDSQKDITAGMELNGLEYLNGECYIPTSAPIKVSYYVYQISIGNNSEDFIGKDYKTVENTLKGSGFSNVRTEEISSGWAKEGAVTKLTVNGEDNYKNNNTYDPDAKIVVQYSSGGRINATSCFSDWQNTNYSKVKANLDKAGFTNVKMIENITDVPSNDELISKIKINNGTFNGGECYVQKDAPIYIDYFVCKLKIGIPSSEIKDNNYKDLAEKLKQKGFSNITIKRADDMYHGFIGFGDWFGSWGTTEGNVKEFSIGGKTDFSEEDSFDFDDEIIITVHTYEDKDYDEISDKA